MTDCTTEAAPIPASPSLTDTAKRKRTEDDHETSFEHPAKKIREEARLGIEKQASRMIEWSKRKLKALSPGDNVAIPVPLVDRSKLDSPNVIGVILSTDEYGYVVGTKSERIKGKWLEIKLNPSDTVDSRICMF